jgi:hypothetical protein
VLVASIKVGVEGKGATIRYGLLSVGERSTSGVKSAETDGKANRPGQIGAETVWFRGPVVAQSFLGSSLEWASLEQIDGPGITFRRELHTVSAPESTAMGLLKLGTSF